MLSFIARFFGTDAEARAALNDIAKVAVEFEHASQKIRRAESKLAKTRAEAVSNFRRLKSSTFDRTFKSCSRLIQKADKEETTIEETYAEAKTKLAKKREVIDRLNRTVASLDFADPA